MDLINSNIDTLADLCSKHRVTKLFAFGSVLTDKFSSNSDIDLIVDFEEMDLRLYADNYFDLKSSLESVLKREVDLLEEKAIKNPYFKKAVDAKKVLIYGGGTAGVAV